MDKEMIITQMDYTYYTGTVHARSDTDGDGKISLEELEAQGIQNLPPPPDKKKFYTLYMTLSFDSDADNDYQGDGLIATSFLPSVFRG